LITCKLKRVYIEMASICCTYHVFIDKVNIFSDLFTNIAGDTILNFLKEINMSLCLIWLIDLVIG
jgi:hypothetical protein